MSLTFGLHDYKDLFSKLKRDAELLKQEVNSDRFFNFVLTGYSMIDWLKNDHLLPLALEEKVRKDQWIKVCGDIATASKHFILTDRKPITKNVESKRGYGCGRYGVGPYKQGEENIAIEFVNGTKIQCHEFVEKVVNSWENFLKAHGLTCG